MITDEDKERVRQATDIVALVSETVVLRQRGGDFWGCCPFHQEKSPSFHVNPTTGLWYCFGCHQGGDVFHFVMKREGLDFLDSVRYLADRAHIELAESKVPGRRGPKRSRLIEVLEAAQALYARQLMRGKGSGADAARAYFGGRGLNSKICATWHLGYADGSGALLRELQSQGFTRDEIVAADLANVRNGRLRDQFFNRVMFPIHDEQGNCIGFGGRVMSDAKPKYLNTKETSVFHKSKHMFAFDYAKESIAASGYAIVTEGYVDVITMHAYGFTNTVAALGTALSADHVRTLSRFAKTIICMFDGDAAGQHAAEASVQYIEQTKASMRCVVLPDDLDPDEFLRAHGADAMREQLKGARPLLDFVVDKKLEGLDLSSPGLRIAALDEMAAVLAPLKDSYLLDGYATQLASRLSLDVDAVKSKIRSTPVAPARVAVQVGSRGAGVRDGGGWRDANAPARSDAQRPRRDDEPPLDAYAGFAVEGDDGPEAFDAPASAASASSGGPGTDLFALSSEDRAQIRAERNLLGMLAEKPDLFRPYADRIATFAWADARNETIAWAILATPEGTTPAEAVIAATRACPDAPVVLSSGGFSATSSWDDEKNVEFVVNEAEIRSLDRRCGQLAVRLEGSEGEESIEALRELSELRSRRAQLRAAQPLE